MEKEILREAEIFEIFSSVQGEGPFMGIKQVFIKFAGCNLRCRFCDLDTALGAKKFDADKVVSIIKQICENNGAHHSVAFTGGEPLLQKDYMMGIFPAVKDMGLKVYLETNGTLFGALEDIIGMVDIVAVDFKLPSSTGEEPRWREHAEFLKIASRKNCFVKVVVTNETEAGDIKKAVDIIHSVDKDLLLVLQPVWPVRNIQKAHNTLLFDYLFLAESKLKNARIIPQMHKILRVK